MPVRPTFFRSATPAIPPMMVRNTMGPISIFIASMKVVPIGSIEVARSGHRHPRKMPMTIARSTCTYNCRHHGFDGVRPSTAARSGVCVIATSSRHEEDPTWRVLRNSLCGGSA